MLRAHSTAEKSSLAASSHILSMPITLVGWTHCPYRDVGYGSARSSSEIYEERYGCAFNPAAGSPPARANCPGSAKPAG